MHVNAPSAGLRDCLGITRNTLENQSEEGASQ